MDAFGLRDILLKESRTLSCLGLLFLQRNTIQVSKMDEGTKTEQEMDYMRCKNREWIDGQLPSLSRRAAAQMIDFMILATVFILITYQMKGVWLMLPGDHLWIIFDPICGAFLIGIFAYFIGMEGLLGFTLGKLITGIRVVSEQGKKITMKQSVKRNLGRLIDGIAVYIIGIRIARSSKLRQRYGDKIGQTVVVLNSSSFIRTKAPFVLNEGSTSLLDYYSPSGRNLLFMLLFHRC